MKNILKGLLKFAFLLLTSFSLCAAEQVFYAGYQVKTLEAGTHGIGQNYVTVSTNLSVILPALNQNNAVVYKHGPQGFSISTYIEGIGWDPTEPTLTVGEGAIVSIPTTTHVVFCGRIPSGEVETKFPFYGSANAYYLFSSKIPVEGKLTTDLGFIPANGDAFYKPKTVGGGISYDVFIYDPLFIVGGWFPSEPTLELSTPIWRRSLSPAAPWKQTAFTNTHDDRPYGAAYFGPGFFDEQSLIQVYIEQRDGESLVFEFSQDLVNWIPFTQVGVLNGEPQTWAAFWTANWFYTQGTFRIRVITSIEP